MQEQRADDHQREPGERGDPEVEPRRVETGFGERLATDAIPLFDGQYLFERLHAGSLNRNALIFDQFVPIAP